MSDELNPTETEVEAEETKPQGDGSETEIDWKSEARKWEKRAKEANALREDAEKWREYEAAQKPAQERMVEDLASARAEAEAAKQTLLRYEIAAAKAIPAEAVKLLTGSTKEDLEESADTLLSLIANQSKPKSPQPDPSQGKPVQRGTSTANAFADAIGDLL